MANITIMNADGSIVGPTPEAVAPSPRARGAVMQGAAGTVSAVAKRRIEADETALRAIFGNEKIDAIPPVYERGSRVNSTGVANFRKLRREHDAMPRADHAAFAQYTAIRAEGREDMDIDLSLAEPGEVPGTVLVNGENFTLTPTAWEHFFQLAGAPKYAAAHAPYAPPAVLHAMLKEYRPKDARRLVAAFRKGAVAGINGERALPAGAGGEIYRIASERYTPFDADAVLGTLLATSHDLMAGWKGDITYDGEKLSFDLISMPDEVIDLAAGDVFKIGMRLRANDVREGGIIAELLVWRNLCLNLIIIGRASTEILNLRHMGNPGDIHMALAGVMAQAEVAFGHFRHQWGIARSEIIITPQLTADRMFEGLAASKITALPGDTGAVKTMLLNAWLEEPGFSRADVVNAVTRAAHESARYADPFAISKVEEAAGSMLRDTRLVSKVEAALADLDSKKKVTVRA